MAENPLQQFRSQAAGGVATQNPLAAMRSQTGAAPAQQAPPTITPAPPASGEPSMAWGDVGRGIISNFGASAKQFGSDLVQPILHPIETGKAVGSLALGAAQKLIPGEQDSEKYADAVGKFFSERYGGVENIKRTMAEDPVGFLADASTVLTGGAGAAARGAGAAGKMSSLLKAAGEVSEPVRIVAKGGATLGGAAGKMSSLLKAAGEVTDPVRIVAKGGSILGGAAGKVGTVGMGWLTGAGGTAVREAARTGALGGHVGKRFRDAMRGETDLAEVVEEARGALNVMRHERGLAYRKDMAALAKDKTVLDFNRIDDAFKSVANIKRFKGKDLSPSTGAVRGQIREVLDDWRTLDPAEYHTPEGLDAMKQRVGDIMESQAFGTPERKVAADVYQSIRGTIAAQAPEYAKTMRSYERASNQIRDIEKSLSLGKQAAAETSVRKLQGIMKNDVTSAFGKRAEFARKLEDAGAKGLFESMAGSTMSSMVPRGMATVGGPGAVMGGAAMTSPGLLAMLPATSPRIVGEVVHGAARLAGPAARGVREVTAKMPRSGALMSFQTGRLADLAREEDFQGRIDEHVDRLGALSGLR